MKISTYFTVTSIFTDPESILGESFVSRDVKTVFLANWFSVVENRFY